MSTTTTEIRQSLPTGTWRLDPVHSTIDFEIQYMVGAFRGRFADVQATLEGGTLTGSAQAASVDVRDENLAAHLQSPEFFDAERHPELRFVSTDIAREGDAVTVRGELTLKGVTQPIELRGTIVDPITDPYGQERIGLKLSGSVDRTAFGLDWNNPLPTGEPALANDVTLIGDLYFVRAA